MNPLAAEMRKIIAEGLTGRTLTSCSRWATKRRIMGGDFPGPYSWKYHPWVKELHDTQAPENFAMKGAQLGVTEVAINRAFFTIDQLKRDVLYVLPTAQTASDFSKGRFTVALKNSPYLASIFTDTNTVNLKQAGTCNLYIRGSRGESNLVSLPVSELILDELDRMAQKEVAEALERLSGQLRKCVWGLSTPTIPNFGIHKLYVQGTQEHYTFRCPHCSRYTELIYPDCLEIVGDSVHDPKCNDSFLKCKECKHKLEHAAKPEWLSDGIWTVTAPNANPNKRTFYINQLYSFTVTPGELAIAYFRGLGDEAMAKEFHNSKLGLPFVGEGSQVTDDLIEHAVGRYTMNDERPRSSGRLITLGIDQGQIVSHWVVCEWFVDQLSSDINVAAVCKVLAHGKFGGEDWHVAEELMSEWQVLACVVDADPQIAEARRFAKKFPGYVTLCRYRRGKVAKEISLADDESGVKMATVDRTNWLTASLGRFRNRRIMLPADVTPEYREMMKALVRTYEKDESGNYVATFVETAPDHYAHAFNYAEIALPLAASITTGKDVSKFL